MRSAFVVMGETSRVSIPSGVRKIVEEIKEITTCNYSEDEVYAMLKECSMDPNETVERLLLQDPFHVVKGKHHNKIKESNTGGRQQYPNSPTRSRAAGHFPAAARNNIDRGNVASRFLSNGKPYLRGSTGNRERFSFRSPAHNFSGTKNMSARKQMVGNRGSVSKPSKACVVDVKCSEGKPSQSKLSSLIRTTNDVPKVSCTTKEVQSLGKADVDLSSSPDQAITSNTFQRKVTEIVPSSNYSNHLQPDVEGKKGCPNKEMEKLKFSNHSHVILPNHIRVPEAERVDLIFGSFHSSSIQKSSHVKEMIEAIALEYVGTSPSITVGSEPTEVTSECLQSSEEIIEAISLEDVGTSPSIAVGSEPSEVTSECLQSSEEIIEAMSLEDVGTSPIIAAGSEPDDSKTEIILVSETPVSTHSVAQTLSPCSKFVTVELGGQNASFENVESSSSDTSHLSEIVGENSSVQLTQGPASAFVGNQAVGVIPSTAIVQQHQVAEVVPNIATVQHQVAEVVPNIATVQQHQVVGVVSNTAVQQHQAVGIVPSTAIVQQHQAFGVMSHPTMVQQHPPHIFQQPTDLHMSHYPNLIPYSQHFSPFYFPPQSIHPHASNATTFPQQHPAGNICPPHLVPTSALRFSQFKARGNNGNSGHVGFPTGFAPYRPDWANYNLTPTTSAIHSTRNDIPAHLSTHQSEGLIVRNPPPGRNMSNSFYPASVGFTPIQEHVTSYPGIFNPALIGATAPPFRPPLQYSQNVA